MANDFIGFASIFVVFVLQTVCICFNLFAPILNLKMIQYYGAWIITKAPFSFLNSNSYILTTGDLGLATRKYTLKRYRDGTFDLRGRLDASQVDLAYSSSAGKYFALMTAVLPSELTLADNDYVFTGGAESSGIYSVSIGSIQNKTLSFYLSADADPGRISSIRIGFKLEGNWK